MKGHKSYIFRSPISVQMEITNVCNNRCVFCYNGDVNINPNYMALEQATHIIDELAENKVFTVVFTGGEPMLNKELADIVAYAKKNGLYTGIITNGTLLNEKSLNKLKNVGLEGIQVSMLGNDVQLHDSIAMNQGAFKKAVDGLSLANKMGFRTSVNTTITRLNFQHLEDIIKVIMSTGTTNFSITRYIHNDFNKEDMLSLTIKEFNDVVHKLLEYKDDLNVRISNCAPLCSMDSTQNPTDEVITIMAPCDCAKTWIGIDVNGNVLPCPSFRHNCGCLHDKKLNEIWESDLFMIKIRENGFCSGACITCDYVNICGGGCKSNNIDKDGRLIGADPYITRT